MADGQIEFKNAEEEAAFRDHKAIEADPRASLEAKIAAFYRWLSTFHGEEIKVPKPKEPPKVTVLPFNPPKTKPFKSKWRQGGK